MKEIICSQTIETKKYKKYGNFCKEIVKLLGFDLNNVLIDNSFYERITFYDIKNNDKEYVVRLWDVCEIVDNKKLNVRYSLFAESE
jgi:hypothetical protein